jgi:secreted trypsin-like serine protease
VNTPKKFQSCFDSQLPILSMDHCSDIFKDIIKIGEGQICVGGDKGKDSCSGDSGGPLMKALSSAKGPRYFLVGIVSFGSKNCGELATPALYTKTNHYMDWILNEIQTN